MKLGVLNRRHPSVDVRIFRQYEALYRGGTMFRSMLDQFLVRNPLEEHGIYELRKRDARYRSYVGPITDFFAAQLFASPLVLRATRGGEPVDADPFYAEFKEDVDGAGADLVTFMKGLFVRALVKKASWVLAEMPGDEGSPAASRAEWEERGLGRAVLREREPESVLDWEVDEHGRLTWAITYTSEMRRDNPRLGRSLVTETWKLYDASTVETFRIVYDPKERRLKDEDEIPSVGVAPHGFPRVPLVRLELPDGLWLLNRVADAQIAHFACSAAMSWALKRTCYPLPVFKSKDPDKPPSAPRGAGYVTVIDVDEDFVWASPTSAAFDVLQREIESQKDEIYRVAQNMAASVNNSAAGLQRSGESKLADTVATEICLRAYGAHVLHTIEEVLELVSDGRGDLDVRFSVEGLNKFSLADVSVTLDNVTKAKSLGIQSKTLAVELGAKAANLLLPDAAQQVLDNIRAEIQASADAGEAVNGDQNGGPAAEKRDAGDGADGADGRGADRGDRGNADQGAAR